MSLRAWARSRGIPASTAAKALRDGRIDRLASGGIDPEAADRAWVERTRLRVDSRVPTTGFAGGQSAATRSGPATRLRAARATHETYKAKKAKLEFEKLEGVLVYADNIGKRWFVVGRRVRDAVLGAADRIAPVVTGMSDPAEIHKVISAELAAALEPLADEPVLTPKRRRS